MPYLKRIADEILAEKLKKFGAVLIEGPRWCGKATTARQITKKSEIDLGNPHLEKASPQMQVAYRAKVSRDPSDLLQGEKPMLIKEWQDVPQIWSAIQTMVGNEKGLFILTGSNRAEHSESENISYMKMLPMSLWESEESNGKISLQQLFDEPNLDIDGIKSDKSLDDIISAACRGGWSAIPDYKDYIGAKDKDTEVEFLFARSYFYRICQEEISKVSGVQIDEEQAKFILKAYARNISQMTEKGKLVKDVLSSGKAHNVSCTKSDLDDCITALKQLFFVDDVEIWSPFSSELAGCSGTKHAFTDPSIAIAALGYCPECFMHEHRKFGFIFEQMCLRDLRVYTTKLGGKVYYYRDEEGLEADFVLCLPDKRYALIECKLAGEGKPKTPKNLLKLRNLIREHGQREPDLLILLTAGQNAYTLKGRVKAVPLACLKP